MMGDTCIEYFVLKESDDDVSLNDAYKYCEYFVFNKTVYEIDKEASKHYIIMADGHYTAMTKDKRIILAFVYYDGGTFEFK
ncbi:MAG: hypothetical protein QM500_04495, partial [Methylococcales bacterium]